MRTAEELKELIDQLPPEFQEEVRDFVEFLLEKKVLRPKREKEAELRLDWRGALRELRDKYTSVELQHKILEWWGDCLIMEKPLEQLGGDLFHWGKGKREDAIKIISDVLAAEPKVLFAYVYGSFLEDRPFHDIDIGVYLAFSEKTEANFFALDLGMKLESVLKASLQERIPPVDVRVLNWAPPSFAYHLIRGRLLFSRDEDLRVCFCVWAMWHYLDLKPLRDRALKEAIRSWSSTGK
jgi:predicted nucleotidyltransferase